MSLRSVRRKLSLGILHRCLAIMELRLWLLVESSLKPTDLVAETYRLSE